MTKSEPPRMGGHFDIDAVRRNFQRAVAPPAAAMPEKLAEVRAPRDPFVVARADLSRVRTIAETRHSRHVATLAPFLDRASQLLDRMEAVAKAGEEGGEAAEDPDALRDELQAALNDLEDLFEVFSGMGRR